MRQRISFLQKPEDAINPKLVKVAGNAISAPQVKAARHDRVTYTLDELPKEFHRALKAVQELHIRWGSPNPYEAISPVVSRVSSGLHVFYTQLAKDTSFGEAKRGRIQSQSLNDALCPLLERLFGDLGCVSEQSFIALPSDYLDHGATTYLHFHDSLPDLSHLAFYLQHKICDSSPILCPSLASILSSAATLDIDFSLSTRTLILSSYIPPRTQSLSLQIPASTSSSLSSSRLEVGLLTVEPPIEDGELSLGGFRAILGQDDRLKPTLFSFPSRHHPSSSSFSARLLEPTGLHPTLELKIDGSTAALKDHECTLNTYISLPKAVFPDRYQFMDSLFLDSKNLSILLYVSSLIDLEAPAYAVESWGSSLLLQLARPLGETRERIWTTQIPLHLRYISPSYYNSGLETMNFPDPVVFWTCPFHAADLNFGNNPFDRAHLGYDSLFPADTIFYHLQPVLDVEQCVMAEDQSMAEVPRRLTQSIRIPVLDLNRAWFVEGGTTGIILVGFVWVIWCLSSVWLKSGYGSRKYGKEKKIQ